MTKNTPSAALPNAFFLLIFIIAYMALFVVAPPLFADPDISWHIMAGDYIREHFAIPATDPWSATAGNTPWYNISWLWDIGLSLIHSVAGSTGVFFISIVLVAGLVPLGLYLVSKRGALDSNVLLLLAGLLIFVLMEFTNGRPQIAAFYLVLLFHHQLHISRGKSDYRHLRLLPLLMLCWVNMHGSFLVGFVVLGAYGLEAIYRKDFVWLKRLLIISVICVCMIPINPYGFGLITGVLATLDSAVTKHIREWLPFVFGSSMGITLVFVLWLLASNLREKTVMLADKILTVLWLFAMLGSVRNAGFFLLLSLPYLAINMQRFLEALEHIRTERKDIMLSLQKPFMTQKLLLVLAVVMVGSSLASDMLRKEDMVEHEKYVIGPALEHYKTQHAGQKLFNDYTLGGRIIYETNGTLPVFVDGRAGTAYPESLLEDYITVQLMEEGWQEVLERYNVRGILLMKTNPLVKLLDAGSASNHWRKTYEDDAAVVYVKR